MLLYFYQQYIIKYEPKFLRIIIAIEIAYMKALRVGDLGLFNYSSVIIGRQHLT